MAEPDTETVEDAKRRAAELDRLQREGRLPVQQRGRPIDPADVQFPGLLGLTREGLTTGETGAPDPNIPQPPALLPPGLPQGTPPSNPRFAQPPGVYGPASPILQAIAPQLARSVQRSAGGGPAAAPATPAAAGSPLAESTHRAVPKPPEPKYSDPLLALGNPITVLALIGSLFTRTPATAALNTAASAIKAQQEGDHTKFINEYTKYQGALKQLHEETLRENAEYKREWENKRLSLMERTARMRGIATRRGDRAMNQYLDAGGDVGAILDQRGRAVKPISDAFAKRTEIARIRKEHAEDNDGRGISYADAEAIYKVEKEQALSKARGQGTEGQGFVDNEGKPLTGEALLSALPPGMGDYIRAIAEGRERPPPTYSKEGRRIHLLVNQYKKDFDARIFNATSAVLKDLTSGMTARNIKDLNTLVGHLGALADSSEALNNSGWRSANIALNAWLNQTGDPRIAQFEADLHAVLGEAGRVFKGQVTEGEIKRWQDVISSANSPQQLKAFISEMAQNLIASRIEAQYGGAKRGMLGTQMPPGVQVVDPHAQDVLDRLKTEDKGTKEEKPKGLPLPGAEEKKSLEDIWK